MAIEKYSNRDDALLTNKEDYVRIAHIMAECDPEDVLIVGSKITEDEAREKVKSLIANDNSGLEYGVNFKLIEELRKAGDPVVHKEYYSVISTYFHISQVEFDYHYRLNGNLISMNPQVASANMDFCAAVETLDGRYRQKFNGDREPLEVWDNLLESECIEDFEEGFKAHPLLAEDSTRESKESMKILGRKLKNRLIELKQADLGTARQIAVLNVINKEYTYVTKVLAAPFYVFNFDLGTKIVTITVDAYSGKVSTPVVNNPLALVLLAKPGEEPRFSLPICIVCGVAMIGLGALIYYLNYVIKKKKYDNATAEDAPKYSLAELKALL